MKNFGQNVILRAVSTDQVAVEPYEEGIAEDSDEAFFSSQAYQEYLLRVSAKDIAQSGTALKITLQANPQDENLAYTDLSTGSVVINVCNSITAALPNRSLRSISIEGLRAHEAGHQLYTDASAWERYHRSLEVGEFYPPLPEYLDDARARYGAEILKMATGRDPVGRTVVLETAKTISNILEDGWVDTRYSQANPGRPADGIALNDIRIREQIALPAESLREGQMAYTVVQNELLRYANGEMPDCQAMPEEIRETCTRVIAIAEQCMLSPDGVDRCDGTNRILLEIWPLLRKGITAMRAQTDKIPPPPGKKRKPAGAAEEAVRQALRSQQLVLRPNQGGRNGPLPRCEAKPADPMPRQRAMESMLDRLREASQMHGDACPSVTPTVWAEGTSTAYALAVPPPDLRGDPAGSRRQQQLQEEALSVPYGDLHRGITLEFHRQGQINQDVIDLYQAVAPPLITLSRRLQKSVERVIRDRADGGHQTGLYSGRKLNQHGLGRRDGRVFRSNRALTEPVQLAVGLLIDESGSSATRSRLKRAGTVC